MGEKNKKKNIKNSILLLVIIGLFYCFPIFKSGFYSSHDGEAHVARFGAYIKAFNDGQIPLRWAGDLNFGYGSPVLLFYYPIPGMVSIPFNMVGLNLEDTFKIVIILSFLLSFVSFYLWIRELTKDNYLSVLGAILYGLTPYHFLNLYVRAGIAELLALSIAPLVFLYIEKVSKDRNIRDITIGGVLYAALILSHNSVSLLFSPILFVYSLIRSKDRVGILCNLSILAIGLSLSSFFWLPAIIESKYTNAKLFIGDMYKEQFPSFRALIFSSWGFGPEVNDKGGLSPQIGVINWILALFALTAVYVKRKINVLVLYWLFVFSFSVFLVTPFSTFIWEVVPLLKNLQFPWRIVGISSFAAVTLGVLLLKNANSKIRLIVLLFVVLYSLQFLKINSIPKKEDSFYMNYSGTTYYHGEASSIWTAGDFGEYPDKKLKIISGDGKIKDLNRKSNVHEFKVLAKTDIKILDNTVYFPGWQVEVNGQKTHIEFQDANHRGLITFNVPKGEHTVKVIFRESGIRLISDIISLLSLGVILIAIIFKSTLQKIINRK